MGSLLMTRNKTQTLSWHLLHPLFYDIVAHNANQRYETVREDSKWKINKNKRNQKKEWFADNAVFCVENLDL